ncbi:chaperone protein ClpB3, chloroplastic [Artemisia annua]|uniref:Chaperone protein ClpB3, chloroplastic n=1 Tax=Artemisia annua TaxID=35608 RepID=A0A2U1LZW6_ARTAN|nr:chaperone protein ClpB3, chloroplastic [Artemisia annua]
MLNDHIEAIINLLVYVYRISQRYKIRKSLRDLRRMSDEHRKKIQGFWQRIQLNNNQCFLKQHTNVLLIEKGRLVRAGIILAHCWWSRIIFSYVDQGEYFLRVRSSAAEVSCIYNNIKFILVLCGRITHPKSLEKHRNLLQKYGQALMAMAGEGKLDPVTGRDDEIRRCIQILSRRTKNKPVLIVLF